MKALIDNITFNKEFETKFGILYSHKVFYYDENDEIQQGFYNSKKKEQTYFKPGQEAEFDIEIKHSDRGDFTVIKPAKQGKFSPYNRNVKKEQSRYSGFAMSYAKDLVIADKIPFDQILPAAEKMFKFMVQLDKSIEDVNS